jgi:hypothetical protein
MMRSKAIDDRRALLRGTPPVSIGRPEAPSKVPSRAGRMADLRARRSGERVPVRSRLPRVDPDYSFFRTRI